MFFKPKLVGLPLVGVGPVRFGMNRQDVRKAMATKPNTFEKAEGVLVDGFYDLAFQVFFDKDDKVEYVEISRAPSVRVSVHGVFPLDMPATKALTTLEAAGGEAAVPEDPDGFSFIFPNRSSHFGGTSFLRVRRTRRAGSSRP